MNTSTTMPTRRRVGEAGLLLLALLALASCVLDQGAAPPDEAYGLEPSGTPGAPAAREGRGRALAPPAGDGAGDEEPSARPQQPAGNDAPADGLHAARSPRLGECTTPEDMTEVAEPAVAEVPLAPVEPEGMPEYIPTSDEVRENLGTPEFEAPSAETIRMQAQYLREAQAIELEMAGAESQARQAHIEQRKAELLQ